MKCEAETDTKPELKGIQDKEQQPDTDHIFCKHPQPDTSQSFHFYKDSNITEDCDEDWTPDSDTDNSNYKIVFFNQW